MDGREKEVGIEEVEKERGNIKGRRKGEKGRERRDKGKAWTN